MTEILYEKRLLRVEEYEEMGRTGILGPEERVELIHGEIVRMSPQSPQHARCVGRLNNLFGNRLYGSSVNALVVSQLPLLISEHDLPEPDVALVRRLAQSEHHTEAADALLVVEVSVTTLAYDRQVKLPLYATAGVPEVWIVNFDERVVEVYREPSGGRYTVRHVSGVGAEVGVARLPEMGTFTVEEILG